MKLISKKFLIIFILVVILKNAWYKFNFVQNLHSKIGYPIWLNIGNKFHHPKICPKILYKVLNML